MANKKSAPEGVNKKMDEGVYKRSAADEDDVEGHVFKKSAPEGVNKKMDEGVYKRSAADEDDVEGHMIGTMNPVLARDLARAKESDVQRAASRNNLINEAKRAVRRKD